MSEQQLRLEVATPTGMQLDIETEWVQARSVRGYLGILPGHRPLLAALQGGLLKYGDRSHEHVVAVGPGFAEVEPDRVLLLTDHFAGPTDIKIDDVRKAYEETNTAMKEFGEHTEEVEYRELERKLHWLEAQIQVWELSN